MSHHVEATNQIFNMKLFLLIITSALLYPSMGSAQTKSVNLSIASNIVYDRGFSQIFRYSFDLGYSKMINNSFGYVIRSGYINPGTSMFTVGSSEIPLGENREIKYLNINDIPSIQLGTGVTYKSQNWQFTLLPLAYVRLSETNFRSDFNVSDKVVFDNFTDRLGGGINTHVDRIVELKKKKQVRLGLGYSAYVLRTSTNHLFNFRLLVPIKL